MLMESPLYGVPVAVIAERCQVHPDTARRWKRTGNIPKGALALLKVLHNHDLGETSEAWAGWAIRGGDLVSPQGDRFSPGLVLAGKYYREMSRDRDRRRRLALSDACESDPLPSAVGCAFSSVSVP